MHKTKILSLRPITWLMFAMLWAGYSYAHGNAEGLVGTNSSTTDSLTQTCSHRLLGEIDKLVQGKKISPGWRTRAEQHIETQKLFTLPAKTDACTMAVGELMGKIRYR